MVEPAYLSDNEGPLWISAGGTIASESLGLHERFPGWRRLTLEDFTVQQKLLDDAAKALESCRHLLNERFLVSGRYGPRIADDQVRDCIEAADAVLGRIKKARTQ